MTSALPLVVTLLAGLGSPPPLSAVADFGALQADSGPAITRPYWAHRLSNDYAGHAIGLALLLSAADEDDGERFFRRVGDAALWTGLATQVLKYTIRAPRPSGGGRESFPSGHSSAAFSLATALSREYPTLTPLWYAWAGAVAYSRVVLGRHRWSEVIVGGLLGIGVSDWAMHRDHSIVRHLQRTWRIGSGEVRVGPALHPSGVSLLRARW